MNEEVQTLPNLDQEIIDVFNDLYGETHNIHRTVPKLNQNAHNFMDNFKVKQYDLDIIFNQVPIALSGYQLTGIPQSQLVFKRIMKQYDTSIRIVEYSDNKESFNNHSPINVNLILRSILSDLVFSGKTFNILVPILDVDVLGEDLLAYKKLQKERIESDKYYSVQITEKFFSIILLDQFLLSFLINKDILRSIIYQAIDVLYKILKVYPTFHSNQMSPTEIYCYVKKNNDVLFPELKLGNFYLSDISGIITNDDANNLEVGYGDLHKFLKYLWENNKISIEEHIKDFFDYIYPKEVRNIDRLTPDVWETLSDELKENLSLANLRNNKIFDDKKSMNLIEQDFVENTDKSHEFSPDNSVELTGGINDDSPNEISNNSIMSRKSKIEEFSDANISESPQQSVDLTKSKNMVRKGKRKIIKEEHIEHEKHQSPSRYSRESKQNIADLFAPVNNIPQETNQSNMSRYLGATQQMYPEMQQQYFNQETGNVPQQTQQYFSQVPQQFSQMQQNPQNPQMPPMQGGNGNRPFFFQ